MGNKLGWRKLHLCQVESELGSNKVSMTLKKGIERHEKIGPY